MPPSAPDLVPFARRLALAARRATLSYFRTERARPDNKAVSGYDPVTQADRAAERAIIDIIRSERPLDAIEGEETGSHEGSSGFTWHLDPIDGTRAYVAGLTSWTTLIGLVEGDRPMLGVIDQPCLDEMYIGTGAEAWLEHAGTRLTLRTSACDRLDIAILSTTDPFILTATEQAAFSSLRAITPITRYGLDAYGYARLAAGGIDVVAETGLKAYDVAALIPVIRGAGGAVADWDGSPAKLGGRILAAATPTLLQSALDLLGRTPLDHQAPSQGD